MTRHSTQPDGDGLAVGEGVAVSAGGDVGGDADGMDVDDGPGVSGEGADVGDGPGVVGEDVDVGDGPGGCVAVVGGVGGAETVGAGEGAKVWNERSSM